MRKVLILGSAAVLTLIFVAVIAPVARGAPVSDRATMECPDLCVQFVPAAPVAMQDIEDSSIEIVVAPTRRQIIEGIGEFIVSADTGKVLLAVLYLQPVIDEIVVASCDQPISSPVEIIGIARDCSAWEVVAFTEKVFGVSRTFTAIFGNEKSAEMMIAAVETRARYTVLRM